MTTPLDRRIRLAIGTGWMLFWLLMIFIAVQDYVRSGRARLWEPVLWDGSSGLVITVLMLLYLRRPLDDRLLASPGRWLLSQLHWLPVFCASFTVATFAIRHAVYAAIDVEYRHEPWGDVFLYESVKLTIVFFLFMAVRFGIRSYAALVREREAAQRAAMLLRQAQLQALAAQIRPHFLFNALNTVSALIHTDPDRADAMLARLAGLLRTSLDIGERDQVALREELSLLRDYADLMAERFADRVTIAWDIDDAALDCRVPPLLLQPLLENTFRHTVERRSAPVRITVAAHARGAELVLAVEDDAGTLAPDAPPGIGTRSLRERLEALHGERATFALTPRAPAGVRAEARLPCAC